MSMGKTFKEMTFAEKREHIWEYYRLHILGGVIVLAVLGNILYGIFNPPPATYAQVTLTGQVYAPEEAMNSLCALLGETLALNPEAEEIQSFVYTTLEGLDIEYQQAMMQRFSVMVAASEIDVLLTEEAGLAGLADQGIALDLREALDAEAQTLLGDKLRAVGGVPLGVSLGGSEALARCGLPEGLVAVVVSNSRRVAHGVEVIRVLAGLL
jgi:hypothetical protein